MLRGRRLFSEEAMVLREGLRHLPAEPDLYLRLAATLADISPAGDRDEIVGLVASAIDLDPESPGTLTRAGFIFLALDELERAEEATSEALRQGEGGFALLPDWVELKGRLAQRAGDSESAERYFTTLFEQEPDKPHAGLLLAETLLGKGDTEGARSVVDLALQHRPQDPDLQSLRDQLKRTD
jgi:tetratricopeptide (TPR) repeat protein